MFLILLLSCLIGFSYSLSCPRCTKKYCEFYPLDCPKKQQIKDACGCCFKCGGLKGEKCRSNGKTYDIKYFLIFHYFIDFIRCGPGLRCVTDFGCRYKYDLPSFIAIQGKCEEELPNEPNTDRKCYQYDYLMKQITSS